MRCINCNYESLNLNAKYCSKCGQKFVYGKYFCSNCGNKILHKSNFCSRCGKKLNFDYENKNDDSKNNMYTKDKEEDLKKETEEKIIVKEKNNNGGDFANMENNIIKNNYLELVPNKNIIEKKEANLLPVVKTDKNLLLPVIIQKKELALIEIKEEYKKLKEHKTALAMLKFVKAVVVTLAKFTRFCFLTIASVIGFIGVAILVIASTAIITKNIVNSYYGITPEPDTTYSIFKMKDDKLNAQSPPKD